MTYRHHRTGYQYQSCPWAVLDRPSPFRRFLNAWSRTSRFDKAICFYIIAGTVGTIIYCFTGG